MKNILFFLFRNSGRRFKSFFFALCALFLIASPGIAQELKLESSSPDHLSAGVPLNATVTFTFNIELDSDFLDQHNIFENVMVRPMDALTVNDVSLSADRKTLLFEVVHEEDVNYVWSLLFLIAENGSSLNDIPVINYTTGPALSDKSISGNLFFRNIPFFFKNTSTETEKSLKIADSDSHLSSYFRENQNIWDVKADRSIELPPGLNDFFKQEGFSQSKAVREIRTTESDLINWDRSVIWLLSDLEWMDSYGGPGDEIKNIASGNSDTKMYQLENVQPGEYYIMAALFFPDAEEFDVLGIGFYSDEWNEPQKINVEDQDLEDIDITIFGFLEELAIPLDAQDAFDLATDFMQFLDDNARPVILWGIDAANSDIFFMKTDLDDDIHLTGESYFWTLIFLNDLDALVYNVMVAGEEAFLFQSMSYDEIPPEDRPPVDIEDIESITKPFISSKAVLQEARDHGLDSLFYHFDEIYWFDVEYELSNFHFDFTDILGDFTSLFWIVNLEMEAWDFENETTIYVEAEFFFDAKTGDFLGKKIYQSESEVKPFFLTFTDPDQMAGEVPDQTTITLGFSDVPAFHSFMPDNRGNSYFVLPQNEINIQHMDIDWEHQHLYYDVEHEPNSDITWIFLNVESQNGVFLDEILILNYATNRAPSPFSVSGKLFIDDGIESNFDTPESDYLKTIVALFDRPDYLQGDHKDYLEDMVAAGKLIDFDNNYRIDNVRNGTYYPAAFSFDFSYGYPRIVRFGFLKNINGEPLSIEVTDQSVSDIDITAYSTEIPPVSWGDAFTVANSFMDQINPDISFIQSYGREEIYPPTHPEGKSEMWLFVWYDEDSTMVHVVNTIGTSIDVYEKMHLDSIPENERPDMDDFLPITGLTIGSQEALAIAMDNGLTNQFNNLPHESMGRIQYHLYTFHFLYPDLLDDHTNAFWDLNIEATVYDDWENTFHYKANYLIDAVNGDFLGSVVTAADKEAALPSEIALYQNYPNPFNPETQIQWQLNREEHVTLSVYDLLGRKVASLVNQSYPAGIHTVTFDASALSSGIYVYRLETGQGKVFTRKMTLLK